MKQTSQTQFLRLAMALFVSVSVLLLISKPGYSDDKSAERLDVNFVEMVKKSEQQIKQNVTKIFTLKNGLSIFSYQYKRTPQNTYIGLMADDVARHNVFKAYVIHMGEGRYVINYDKLGLHPVSLETFEKEGLAALTSAATNLAHKKK